MDPCSWLAGLIGGVLQGAVYIAGFLMIGLFVTGLVLARSVGSFLEARTQPAEAA